MPIGMPCMGPSQRPAAISRSASRAAASARSASTVIKAFSLEFATIFWRHSLTTPTGESDPALICALVSSTLDNDISAFVLHPMPFRQGQCDHDHIENRQRDQPARRLNEVAVHLIDTERGENADRPREGPELVFEQRVYQHRFDDSMRQQVDSADLLAADAEMLGRRAQVGGDEIVGVSTELVVRQADDEALNRAGRKHEQQDAADELEEAVQPLEDDANFEGDVEIGARQGLPTSASPPALHNPTALAH